MPKEPKIIQLDPLAERLSNVGMKVEQVKPKLSKEGKSALKANFKN
jgi:hypothetical protein